MTDITIPPEAVKEVLRAYGCECNSCRKAVMRVGTAMLRAWPGMATIKENDRTTLAAIYLPLPLPQEPSDAKI